jgi:hypothetical protein
MEQRAERVRVPEPTRALLRERETQRVYRAAREAAARVSTARGVLLVALLVLAASVWRAGLDRAFMPGWWHR